MVSSEATPFPNFFIVGAPKCGTTSLYQYLGDHPAVFMPRKKEPFFFCTDLDSGTEQDARYFMRDEKRYRELFRDAGSCPRVGEASALYLYSTVAAEAIYRFNPEARIIMMLRNPVEMVYAYHRERVLNGHEDIDDFREALDAEEDRRNGRRLPPRGANHRALLYRDVASYAAQVDRYRHIFRDDQVKIIIFDDFKRDTAGVYGEVLEFLDLPFMPRESYDVVNPSKVVRSRALRDLLKDPPDRALSLARRILPASIRRPLYRLLYRSNLKFQPRVPMDDNLRRELCEYFRKDVDRLSGMIGRDLTGWCRP